MSTGTSCGPPPRRCGGARTSRLWRARAVGFVSVVAVWFVVDGWRLVVTIPPAGWPPLLQWNVSGSLPGTLYLYAHRPPARVGEVVLWAHPPGYSLAGGRVIKRVAAIGGSTYCWDPELGTQRLDGVPMPPPLPAAVEAGIAPWTGCQLVRPGQVVGYGDSPGSWDARFFGVVAESDLAGVYVRLW